MSRTIEHDFAAELRARMGGRAMTIEELARAVEVSGTTVRRWLSGSYRPRSAKLARRIDSALGSHSERDLFGSAPADDGTISAEAAQSIASEVEELVSRVRALESQLQGGRRTGSPQRGERGSSLQRSSSRTLVY